jgi:phenolic acid decarboxylase
MINQQDLPAVGIPEQSFADIIGKRLFYRYESGGIYELYVKNAQLVDYRIHTGPGGGRWVRDQQAQMARLGELEFRFTWTEPTGSAVSTVINLAAGTVHGVAFFPLWLVQDIAKAEVFQNDHVAETEALRDQGPSYPLFVIHEFATILTVDELGPDDESAIDCSPADYQAGRPDVFVT